MLKVIISIRGLRFTLKDQSIFINYKWDKLQPGENIFNQALGWVSLDNCAKLQDVGNGKVFLVHNPTCPDDFNNLLDHLVCHDITEHKTLIS